MLSQEKFDDIKLKSGHYASWGVWAKQGIRPKDNTGDISVLDPNQYPNLLEILNPSVILVGLNISGRIKIPLGNFHSSNPRSHDYKIRHALENSVFWGCYMTDIIKDFEQISAGRMMQYLRQNQKFEEDNVKTFIEEMAVLNTEKPKIIALGNDAFSILKKHLSHLDIHKVPHYSAAISKETLRQSFEYIKVNQVPK